MIAIRPARPDDAAALAALGRQTFVDTFVTGFGIPYPAEDLAGFLHKSFSVETLQTKLAEPGAAWWVADRDGEILGFANTGPNTLPHPDARPSHAELRRLYIGRDAQGLGLGTKLLKLALDWMEANTDGPCGSASGAATRRPRNSTPPMGSRRPESTTTRSAPGTTTSSSCGAADRGPI